MSCLQEYHCNTIHGRCVSDNRENKITIFYFIHHLYSIAHISPLLRTRYYIQHFPPSPKWSERRFSQPPLFPGCRAWPDGALMEFMYFLVTPLRSTLAVGGMRLGYRLRFLFQTHKLSSKVWWEIGIWLIRRCSVMIFFGTGS